MPFIHGFVAALTVLFAVQALAQPIDSVGSVTTAMATTSNESPAHLGFLFVEPRVAPAPDGRPRVFHVSDMRRIHIHGLTMEMKSTIERVGREIRLPYRKQLAFLFNDWPQGQALVVYLDGSPQYPVLNICEVRSRPRCSRDCPYYVHPRNRTVTASSMQTCAADFPIWNT